MIEIIKREIERQISEQLDKEIMERTKEFHNELTGRKDQYIAEIMKGIRIEHEYNPESMYMDYRIMFINRNIVDPHRRGK